MNPYRNHALLFFSGTNARPLKQTFHAARWAEKVQEREGSMAQEVPEASHWVTRDQPDAINRKLDEFLADML